MFFTGQRCPFIKLGELILLLSGGSAFMKLALALKETPIVIVKAKQFCRQFCLVVGGDGVAFTSLLPNKMKQ